MLTPSSFSLPSSSPPSSLLSSPYLVALPKKIKVILDGQEEEVDPNKVIRTMKTPNHKRIFTKKIEKMRFLGNAQEEVIGQWMMEKWKKKKDGMLLRQYACYEDSKKQVEELFNQLWKTLGVEKEKGASTRDEDESSTASFPFPFESLDFLNF